MAFYQLIWQQKIPSSKKTVWEFISSPENLKKITPVYMGFDIITDNLPGKIYPGMIIRYKVSPLWGIITNWVTEITHVKEGEYFVDEQRHGPYSIWHHQHHLKSIAGGVQMDDIVSYKPPYGIIGTAANHLFIRKKLDEIFNFRSQALDAIFGKWETGNSQ
jgi:ligand-binding SRPBCC domain-containing protein